MATCVQIWCEKRKSKLFFENRSLNRGLLSLYEVKEEKSFEKMTEIRD